MGIIKRTIKNTMLFWKYRKEHIRIGKHVKIQDVGLDGYVTLVHHCQVSHTHVGSRSSIGRYSEIQYAEIGEHCSISWDVTLQDVDLDKYVNLAYRCQVSHAHVGLRTSIGRYSKIQYAEIGKYCSISWDVTIGAISHPLHALSTHAFTYRKQFGMCSEDKQLEHANVVIGNDVWIGCGVIIMPGVRIGDGAVIGAGAIVTHDVAPYEIVAGCPAKHLGQRFPENIVADL